MTYLDNRGLFEQRGPRPAQDPTMPVTGLPMRRVPTRTAMSDTLHELDEPPYVETPPAWPVKRWWMPRWFFATIVKEHVNTWFPVGTCVRVVSDGSYGGRVGDIQSHDFSALPDAVSVQVRLAGGRISGGGPTRAGRITEASPIFVMLSEGRAVRVPLAEVESARGGDIAFVANQRARLRRMTESNLTPEPRQPEEEPEEGRRTPIDMEVEHMHAQARQRDGIIHPHRRLQV